MECKRCHGEGNEGDIGFFIPCKNGCEDLYHPFMRYLQIKEFAKEKGFQLKIENGKVILDTGLQLSEKFLDHYRMNNK